MFLQKTQPSTNYIPQLINQIYRMLRITSKLLCRVTLNQIRPKHLIGFSLPLYTYLFHKYRCAQTVKQNRNIAMKTSEEMLLQTPKKQLSYFQRLINYFWHTIRFFHLMFIFTPTIVLFPLRMFDCTRQYWMDTFVKAIERAGVVWIKAFQYMSHRRDIIGPQMAQKFVHLRQNAPTHSFEQTKDNFKKSYGKEIHEIFEEFDKQPLASGSVSQVYKAVYKGKKVAVKVRHPGVDRYIQRDVNLMFFLSGVAGIFSKSAQIPVGQRSLKRTLLEQTDFNNQKDNLKIFNKMFENHKDVKFPTAFDETTKDSVLVETFVEGVPITYYETNPHPLNAVIARIGAKAFFEMLMKHNFIHADCHGGNMFVQIQQSSSTFLSEVWNSMKQVYYSVEQFVVEGMFSSYLLRKLYAESRKEEAQVRKILRKYKQKVEVTLIDVGMVIRLNEEDRQNFIKFIRSLVEGNGNKCAQMVYSLSNFGDKKILLGEFTEYMNKLVNLFSPLNTQDLDDLEGVSLLTGMLDLVRQYQMKLDGQFATLLTNMLVLEAIAKQLNPNIKLLKCAVPYFAYAIQQQKDITM